MSEAQIWNVLTNQKEVKSVGKAQEDFYIEVIVLLIHFPCILACSEFL